MSLPEGYIASSPQSYTYAVDSATLARNGEVHSNNGVSVGLPQFIGNIPSAVYNGTDAKYPPPLDDHVEFSLKNDPRLEKLKEHAHELRVKYVDPHSRDYIADVRQRERKSPIS